MSGQTTNCGQIPVSRSKFSRLLALEMFLAAASANLLFLESFSKSILFACLGTLKFSNSHHFNASFTLLLPLFRALLVWLIGSIMDQNVKPEIFSILVANLFGALIFSLEKSHKIIRRTPLLIFFGLFLANSLEKVQNTFSISIPSDQDKIPQHTLMFEFILSFSTFATGIQSNLEAQSHEAFRVSHENIRLKNFILTLSHELRNPLNGLLGNLSLAQAEKISNQANENISSAMACGEFLLQFINNILDSGKLEAGGLEINPTRVDPRDFFKKLWRVNADILKMKKLEGQFKINSIPSKIKIDPHRVSQVLFNLIGNAVKFTDKGTIKVLLNWVEDSDCLDETFHPIPYSDDEDDIFQKDMNISIVSQDSIESELDLRMNSKLFSKGYLKIIVNDTGVGMTPEELGRLFQKFSQVGCNNKKQLGSGLGLNIAKEICRKMGGDLRLYSKKNKGTTAIAIIPSQVLSDSSELSERTLEEKKIKIGAFLRDSNRALLQEYAQRIGGECVDLDKNESFEQIVRGDKILDAVYFDADSEAKVKCFINRVKEFPRFKDIHIFCVGEGLDHLVSLKYFCGLNYSRISQPLFFDDFLQSLTRV